MFCWRVQPDVLVISLSAGLLLLLAISGICVEGSCKTEPSWRYTWWIRYMDEDLQLAQNVTLIRTYDDTSETNRKAFPDGIQNKSVEICLEKKFVDPYFYYVRYKSDDSGVRDCVRLLKHGLAATPDSLLIESSLKPVLWSCNFGRFTLCDFIQNRTNTANWQPSSYSRPHGYFMFVHPGTDGARHASIYTPALDYTGKVCVEFAYFYHLIDSRDELWLHVAQILHHTSNTRQHSQLLRALTNYVQPWIWAWKKLYFYSIHDRVEFEARVHGSRSYIAVNQVRVRSSDCYKDIMRCNFGATRGSLCWIHQDQVRDNTDWALHTGSTGSEFTGPAAGYGGSGYYVSLDSNTQVPANQTARLLTRMLYWPGDICVTFRYHMYGSGVNRLDVLLLNEGSGLERIAWTAQGNKGPQWLAASVQVISTLRTDLLAFKAYTGFNVHADIALDEVHVMGKHCDSPIIETESLTVAKCASRQADYPVPGDIFVRTPFSFESRCPFRSGRYLAAVSIRMPGGDVQKWCEWEDGGPQGYIIITGGLFRIHTCVAAHSYDEPLRDVELRCVEELSPAVIGSTEQQGNVLIMAYNATPQAPHFYTVRYKLHDSGDEIEMSIQGQRSGRLRPNSQSSYLTVDARGSREFSYGFHLKYESDATSLPVPNPPTVAPFTTTQRTSAHSTSTQPPTASTQPPTASTRPRTTSTLPRTTSTLPRLTSTLPRTTSTQPRTTSTAEKSTGDTTTDFVLRTTSTGSSQQATATVTAAAQLSAAVNDSTIAGIVAGIVLLIIILFAAVFYIRHRNTHKLDSGNEDWEAIVEEDKKIRKPVWRTYSSEIF